jgi:DNA-binding MarR family transcriptional regulator
MEDIWQTVRSSGKIEPLKAALERETAAATAELEAKKQDEQKKKEEREAWDKDYKEFKDKVGVLKELVKKSKGPEDEIGTILSLVDAGNKMAEKGDVAGARDKLKLAEKRRADLEKCPGGVAVQSAAELAQLKAKWDESLTQLGAKLKELKDAVDKEAGLSQEQRESAVKKINAIPALFHAGAFNKDIDEITKSEDNAVRKKAREKILKQVRQYRALMQANAVVQLARRNPFDVKQVTTPVNKCLASIELNTLRAVRAE